MLPAYEKLASAYEKLASAYEKLAPAYKKLVPAYEKLVPAYEKLVPAYEKLVPAYEKLVPAYEKLASAYDMPASAHEKRAGVSAFRWPIIARRGTTLKARSCVKSIGECAPGDFIIGHDGKRSPAINSTARLNPSTGDGIVLLESGHPLLATLVAGDWVFWKTGTIDFLAFTLVTKDMLAIILLGWGAIILAALFIGWRQLRRKKVAKAV